MGSSPHSQAGAKGYSHLEHGSGKSCTTSQHHRHQEFCPVLNFGGLDCLDWWAWPKGRSKVSDPNTLVAWTGRNPAATHQGAKLRLFKTAFENPQPDKEIKSIDYVSGMAVSAPFMIAMTLEK